MMGSTGQEALSLFYSYAHKDEALRDTLDIHLSTLRRSGLIQRWHDRKITAGSEWKGEISEYLKTARIILLLISPYFIASDYCYDVEMKLAMERHEAGEARVIPIILSPVDLSGMPFNKLQSLPKDRKPITKWRTSDEGFYNVAVELRLVVEELLGGGKKGFA